jgi:hypothetical protein
MVCSRIMRTTISIDDGVLDDLKQRAAQRGTTVSRLIEDSVRLALAGPPDGSAVSEELDLVTYGRGGRFTRLDVDRTSALLELDDLERYGGGRS